MPNFFQRPVNALTTFVKQITLRQHEGSSSSEKSNRKSRRHAFFRHIAEASAVKDHSRIISSDRDWRNLSPMEPPLPVVSASRRVGFSHAVKVVQNLPADMTDFFKVSGGDPSFYYYFPLQQTRWLILTFFCRPSPLINLASSSNDKAKSIYRFNGGFLVYYSRGR